MSRRATASGPIRVERADGERWGDLCGLFGRAGASNGCWCQYWLLGPGYYRRDRDLNRDALGRECLHGRAPAPGLIAYANDGRAVGWARLCPRSELDWLNTRFGPACRPATTRGRCRASTFPAGNAASA